MNKLAMNKLIMTTIAAAKTAIKVIHVIAITALLVATAADAAPNIPSSELPGRERQRFQESPIDRFTQPPQQTEPLWRWQDCEPPKTKKRKHSRSASKRC